MWNNVLCSEILSKSPWCLGTQGFCPLSMERLAFRIIASRQLKQVSLVYLYHSHSGNPRMEGLRDQLSEKVPLRKTSRGWREEYTSHTQGPMLFIPCVLYYSDTNSQAYIYPFINNLLVIIIIKKTTRQILRDTGIL